MRLGLVALLAAAPAAADIVLWHNGDTDGSNGYSNDIHWDIWRTLLDDFVVPHGEVWTIRDFHSYQIWNTLPPGTGWDYELRFRADAGNAPGNMITTATTISYSEVATGRFWFDRAEYRTDYRFEDIVLGPGRYWIEGNVDGPENNFWMIRLQVTGNECWVNYHDLGGLMPGSEQFGVAADLAFSLTGIPEPASLLLLGLGALALRRR